MDYCQEINGHYLEYFDDSHLYLVDGQIIPSVTQIIHQKFKNKYKGVSEEVLKRGSNHGTAVHEAIENWCVSGAESDLKELYNFKFLMNRHKITVLKNEVPVVLFQDDEPLCVGRLDLVIEQDNRIGLADIKATSTLDKEYLAYQLNMYRLAYQQSYNTEIEFLKGIHVKDDKRKVVDIPINEKLVLELITEWRKENE